MIGNRQNTNSRLRVDKNAMGWRQLLILLIGVVLVMGGYLVFSHRVYTIGFPLDDAWIHQTYARNLGQNGEWGFLPGQPSAGSTSPMWSALLAAGYALKLPYLPWTFLLGGLSLFALSYLGELLARTYLPQYQPVFPWVGLYLVGEWHLVWASVSGMETLFNAGMILLVLWLASRTPRLGWGWIGLLVGASVWIRPDGITLLGPVAMIIILTEYGWKKRFKGLLWLVGATGLCFAPYLAFNWLVQGSPWPNTFYAKQAEYTALLQPPLLIRFWNELKMPLLGAGLFLVPGFISFIVGAVKSRRWAVVAGGIWFLGYALLYALRLPVTYQYGRYLMPAMPVFFVLGLAGSIGLVEKLHPNRITWILARVGVLSMLCVWVGFYGIGANRYAQDVAIVETEMVASACWIARNTPQDALVAAHDIGAAGYFGQRTLVDLAGLISPEVIPFIRDEQQLANFLDAKHVDYLVVLDGWYPALPEGRELVYQTGGIFSPESGGSNMLVYRWSNP